MNKSEKQIYSNNRPLALVIILVIIIYIITQFFKLINRNDISSYQVKEGSLAISSVYTGIAIRDEKVFQCSDTGYINYLAREGEHLAVGDLLYVIDEGGALDDILSQSAPGENSLSDHDLSTLKTDIINFNSTFDKSHFSDAYDFLYEMDGSILKLANMNILNELQGNNSNINLDLVKLNRAAVSGYVVYHTDGMESLSINSITPELFDAEQYEKTQLVNNALIEQGADAYKMITSEDWTLVLLLDNERAVELMGENYVEIKFLSTQQTVWAGIKVQEINGNYYAFLTLNNSVVTFCNERYIDIELIAHNEQGLKIPTSAIDYRSFNVVPEEYRIDRIDPNTSTFMRKVFLEDGTQSTEIVEAAVYAETEEGIYVDENQLKIGDYLLKEDSMEECPVSQKGELVGVYCINQGYAEFRQIVILYQNDEYAIVQKNTESGIHVYDYIVLDHTTVSPDDFIFE